MAPVGGLDWCAIWESWCSAPLGGCASSAADVAPAYVSPVAYQNYTCQQLALEAQSISTRAATLSGAQDKQRSNDGLATAAAVVIFWPAAFFVGGDKQTAAELSQMKGQMVAVEQASIARKCNIQFQGKPEGTWNPRDDFSPVHFHEMEEHPTVLASRHVSA
jgi:hypothetical protein